MLEDIIKSLEKSFKGTIVKEKSSIKTIVPTGSINIDNALGVGGYPGGRIIELYGAYSSGKSTMALAACKNAAKMGLSPVYVDMEYAFDGSYAEQLGVNLDELIVLHPDHAEMAIALIEHVLSAGSRFIVLDSIGAMVPHRESIDESEIGDNHPMLIARLMSQAMRRLIGPVFKNDVVLLTINQQRAKINNMPTFGAPSVSTPGGNAYQHACSQMIKLGRKSTERDGDVADAVTIAAEVVKNKLAAPFVKTEFDIRFGIGIDTWDEITQMCIKHGVIKKTGAWMKDANGITIGQKVDNVKTYITDNLETVKQTLAKNEPKIQWDFYL